MILPPAEKIEIMGILNCTPDSFSDGGRYIHEDSIKKRIDEIVADGTDIIDIGGESTRPGARSVATDVEWTRIMPAILYCKANYSGIKISVDTYKSEIALRAIDEGADIINDISGGVLDTEMISKLSGKNIPIILMHMQGTPQTMQNDPVYMEVISEIMMYFRSQIALCHSLNVPIYAVDPGIGFGKTPEHNRLLLSNLDSFASFDLPVLVGVSRKSIFKNLLNLDISERDTASAILESMLLFNGASILRTHNTRNGSYIKKLLNYIRGTNV